MGYTFIAVDATDGSRLGELPVVSGKLTRQISAAGSWNAAVKLDDSDAVKRLSLLDNTTNNAIEVAVHRNGAAQPLYTGLLIDREYDSKTQMLAISGRESWSYFDRRAIDSNLTYTNIDQGLIVQDILQRAALPPGGDFRVDPPTTAVLTTGTTRSKSYLLTDAKPISEAIEELAALSGGFEFSLDGYWLGNTLRHLFNFGFPMLGTRGGLFVGWDTQTVSSYRWQEQGGSQVSELWGIGDDASGHISLQRVKTLALQLPLLQLPFSYRAETQGPTLLAATQQQAAKQANPTIGATVSVLGTIHPQVGEFQLGDDVTFQFDDPRFENVSQLFRLMGWTLNLPDASNAETVDLVVATP